MGVGGWEWFPLVRNREWSVPITRAISQAHLGHSDMFAPLAIEVRQSCQTRSEVAQGRCNG